MCQDCPTRSDRLRGFRNELVADLVLPLFLYALPIGLLVLGGYKVF